MYFYYKMYTICKLFYNTFISFQELCMSLRFLPLCPANPVISANICYQTLHHIWWEQCQSPLTACLRRVIQIIAGHIPECSYPNRLISRPLKSTHLRDIARKQCPADFFNK